MFIDSHCHLDFPELIERKADILEKMKENQVDTALCISVKLETFPNVLALAHAHEHLYASVGVHPDNESVDEPDVARLVALASDPKVIAIGETGLDYYWHKDAPQWQRDRFCVHIRAARETKKPLVIHTRSASEDTLRLMREEGADAPGGVMHCFTESQDVARAAMDLGFYISFSGIVTFKNAKELKEVARYVPLDRMLIETDSPYLAPVPYRGKTNEPGFVKHVAAHIAELRGIDIETVAERTSENFRTLFRIGH